LKADPPRLPAATVCIPYSQTTTFIFPYDTVFAGNTCRFTRFTLNSVTNLPTGLNYNTDKWNANPPNRWEPVNNNVSAVGCFIICGTPTQANTVLDSSVINLSVNLGGLCALGGTQSTTNKTLVFVRDTVFTKTANLNPATYCVGSANVPITVSVQVNGNLTASNVYTVQLSDANGSFANPTNIGTLTGGNTGCNQTKTITANIPGGTPAGAGYRVRVVTSQKNTILGTDPSGPFVIQSQTSGPITANGPTTFCAGGSVQLTAPVNPPYSWSNGSTTASITVNQSGTYTVTTGGAGCTSTASIQVTVNPVPAPNLGTAQTVCGSTTLNAGNFPPTATFVWRRDGQIVTGQTSATLSATQTGSYSVTVTNNGCTGSSTVQVTVQPNPTVDLGPASVTACGNTTLNATATGTGLTYQWRRDGQLINGQTGANLTATQSGNYQVTVTAGCGTTVTDNIQVTINAVPNLLDLGPDKIVCGTTDLTATGGGTYAWTRNGQPFGNTATVTVSQSGTYAVTVTGSNGCTATDQIVVQVSPAISVNLGAANQTSCGPKVLDAGNAFQGITYAWSLNGSPAGSSQTLTATQSGNYTVVVSSTCGQSQSATISLTVNPTPTVNLPAQLTQCANSVTLNAGASPGNPTYTWNNLTTGQPLGVNQNTAQVSASGQYEVVASIGNCITRDTVNVQLYPPLDIILPLEQQGCQQTELSVPYMAMGTAYTWRLNGQIVGNSQTLTASTSGVYSVQVDAPCGQSQTFSTLVTINPLPTVDLGPDQAACSSVTLNAGNPGASYAWSTGQNTQSISVSNTGTYTVIVTSAAGCTNSDQISVEIYGGGFSLGGDVTACGRTVLRPTGGSTFISYLWNDNSAVDSLVVTQSGVYSLTVQDVNGCSFTDEVAVTVKPLPVVNLGDDVTACFGETTVFDANLTADSYEWRNAQNQVVGSGKTLTVSQAGAYTLTVVVNGCSGQDTRIFTTEVGPSLGILSGNKNPTEGATESYSIAGEKGDTRKWIVSGGSVNGSDTGELLSVTWGGAGNGTVKVVGFNERGCAGDTVMINVTIKAAASRGELAGVNGLRAYPNPATDAINLTWENLAAQPLTLSATNALGQIVWQQPVAARAGVQTITIPVTGLVPGVYYLRLADTSGEFISLPVVVRN
jgi:hypothetical protein